MSGCNLLKGAAKVKVRNFRDAAPRRSRSLRVCQCGPSRRGPLRGGLGGRGVQRIPLGVCARPSTQTPANSSVNRRASACCAQIPYTNTLLNVRRSTPAAHVLHKCRASADMQCTPTAAVVSDVPPALRAAAGGNAPHHPNGTPVSQGVALLARPRSGQSACTREVCTCARVTVSVTTCNVCP
jgi:hypothetical protein